MHKVGQVGGGDVKALRQQLRNQQYHRRLFAQKTEGVLARFGPNSG